MGLDMYLSGQKFFWHDFTNPENDRKEDGLTVEYVYVRLGYWRKHPNLHGYIVQNFAEGKDECQEIELSSDDLKKIIEATKSRILPHTEGFFFGRSELSEEEIADDVKQLESAIKWLEQEEPKVSRSVIYRASW